jgi:hypothetical protein
VEHGQLLPLDRYETTLGVRVEDKVPRDLWRHVYGTGCRCGDGPETRVVFPQTLEGYRTAALQGLSKAREKMTTGLQREKDVLTAATVLLTEVDKSLGRPLEVGYPQWQEGVHGLFAAPGRHPPLLSLSPAGDWFGCGGSSALVGATGV